MKTPFQPAADLANRLLRERIVSRIWERDISVWRRGTGLECRASRLRAASDGSTSAGRCRRISIAVDEAGSRRPRGTDRVGAPARDGRQQPLRRSAAVGVRRRREPPAALRARHHRRAHHHQRGGENGPGANMDRRREQERRHGRSRVDGAVLLVADGGCSRKQGRAAVHRNHRSRRRHSTSSQAHAATGRRSSTRRTSADAFPRCRCSGWCQRRCSAHHPAISSPRARRCSRAAARTITRTPASSSAPSSAPQRWPAATS